VPLDGVVVASLIEASRVAGTGGNSDLAPFSHL